MLDSATLSTLDGLVLSVCQFAGSTALDSAVQNGLRVMINTPSLYSGGVLPGDPPLSLLTTCNQNLSIAPGSPIATGPGGTLTDTSLDGNFLCSSVGSAAISSLPASSQALVLDAQMPERAVAFAYPFGAGMVAVSMSQWMHVLPGGQYPGQPFDAGAFTYYANTVAWMMPGDAEPETTCASEGYTGTKLLWCQNICEKDYTGATLQTWIHRWIRQFRDLPYCAMEPSVPADS